MRSVTSFNDGWLFEGKQEVSLPHTAVELPFAYFDERSYQRPFTYSKTFTADPAWTGKDVTLVFDGAMANAQVTINGEAAGGHTDGYTPFEIRLTGRLKPGSNEIKVVIDGSENPAIPPFGGQIDYLTYAGIYRDVWLRVTAPVAIGSVKIETPDPLADRKSVRARVELSNPGNAPIGGTLNAALLDAAGKTFATRSMAAAARMQLSFEALSGIA